MLTIENVLALYSESPIHFLPRLMAWCLLASLLDRGHSECSDIVRKPYLCIFFFIPGRANVKLKVVNSKKNRASDFSVNKFLRYWDNAPSKRHSWATVPVDVSAAIQPPRLVSHGFGRFPLQLVTRSHRFSWETVITFGI
jgi:hypothetical protein